MQRSFLPNFITLMNALCGLLAIFMALHGYLKIAALLILAGAIFDFLDGFVARLIKVSSPVGKQLDSLSDLVTFGVAPAFMLVKVLETYWVNEFNLSAISNWLIFIPFLLALFSALRLAIFNVDQEQTTDFMGLPTPANALFQISFVFMLLQHPSLIQLFFVLPVIIIFSSLMVARIPLFSLKSIRGKSRYYVIILFVCSVAAVILFKFTAGVFIIFLYIILSGIKQIFKL